MEKANLGPPLCTEPSRGLCKNRDKWSIYLAGLVSVDQNLKPTSRLHFLSGKGYHCLWLKGLKRIKGEERRPSPETTGYQAPHTGRKKDRKVPG